jgi:uncharacterized metal-binding protein
MLQCQSELIKADPELKSSNTFKNQLTLQSAKQNMLMLKIIKIKITFMLKNYKNICLKFIKIKITFKNLCEHLLRSFELFTDVCKVGEMRDSSHS